jgi:hypothetical protein
MTMNLAVENLSPFARIAQIYCPSVYEQLIDEKEFILKITTTSKYFFTKSNIVFFSLSIAISCIFILLLTGIFLSHLTSVRIVKLALQHRFNIPV